MRYSLKGGVFIPTIFYNDMLVAAVTKVINSDYDGKVYVVSNSESVRPIERISDRVVFVHNSEEGVSPPDKQLSLAVRAFDKDCDIVVYMHNDVIVSPTWYSELVMAWESVGLDKVSGIAMPFVVHDWKRRNTAQYDIDTATLSYNEIINKYSSIELLFPTYTTAPNQLVGTGIDLFNVNLPKYPPLYHPDRADRDVGGKWSSCTSFTYKDYMSALSKYGPDTYYAMEIFMLKEAIWNKKWTIFANATPVIHSLSYDSLRYGAFGTKIPLAYKAWFDVFRYNIEHLIVIWSDLLHNIHRDEIITNINNKNWESIDYIFDKAIALVPTLTCDTCKCYCHVRDTLHIAWADYDVYAV